MKLSNALRPYRPSTLVVGSCDVCGCLNNPLFGWGSTCPSCEEWVAGECESLCGLRRFLITSDKRLHQ